MNLISKSRIRGEHPSVMRRSKLASGFCLLTIAVTIVLPLAAAEPDQPAVSTEPTEALADTALPDPLAAPEVGEGSTAVTSNSIAAFKIIHERNIFNANRIPVSARQVRITNAPPPKSYSFTLVGTLLSEKGHYAFFDGTESQYNTVLKEGEQIAGHTITEVVNDSIQLQTTNDLKIELPIGMQMKRQEEGPWQVIVGTESASNSERSRDWGSSNSSRNESRTSFSSRRDRDRGATTERRERGSASSSVETPRNEPAGDAASAEEILKRLMEQRAKEQNQ